jgi:hypothetical protein
MIAAGLWDQEDQRDPSQSIAAAFQVVAEVQRRFPGWRFSLLGGDVSYGYKKKRTRSGNVEFTADTSRVEAFEWRAEFFGHIDPTQDTGQRHGDAHADSPALAICRAALEALDAYTPQSAVQESSDV